jgi:CRP/FNR family transcriptional regulator, cyclic AMP receptor protein
MRSTNFRHSRRDDRSRRGQALDDEGMTRALHKRSAPISGDKLLAHSPGFGQIGEAAQRQVHADRVERAINAGASLGLQGESQRHGYGVLEGLLKCSINAHNSRTVTLGSHSVGSWFGRGHAAARAAATR